MRPLKPTATDSSTEAGAPREGAPSRSWTDDLKALLDQAARLALDSGLDHDGFMTAAHEAVLGADPVLRERMERATTLQQMEHWRRLGVLAMA